MADENINKGISFASYMPGFIGAGASLLGSFLSNTSADRQAEKQFERQKKLAEIQQVYNKELMDKQSANNMRDWQQQFNVQSRKDLSNAYNNASRQVQALKQAGLNPASGISPYTSVTPSPSGGTTSLGASSQGSAGMAQNTPFSFGDPVGFMQLAQNAPLAKAQARKLNADAEAQEQENTATREENAWYANFDFKPSDKMDYDENGNLLLGDVLSLPSSTRKGVEARTLAKKRLDVELAKLDNEEMQNILASKVASMQTNTRELYEAIANAPKNVQSQIYAAIGELNKKVELYGSQISLNDANKELLNLEKRYNVYGLIDSLRTHLSKFDIKEAFSDIVAIVLRGALSRVGIK